jgi:hypothetical protein
MILKFQLPACIVSHASILFKSQEIWSLWDSVKMFYNYHLISYRLSKEVNFKATKQMSNN